MRDGDFEFRMDTFGGMLRYVAGLGWRGKRASPTVRVPAFAASAIFCTGAMNLYPRRASVSIYLGLDAESPKVSRSLFTAVFRLWSKSTNVSTGHSFWRNSSRVTTTPERSSSSANTWNG